MTVNQKMRDARLALVAFFGLLFLLNVCVFVAALRTGQFPNVLPQEMGGGFRLLFLLAGGAVGWYIAHQLYAHLVECEVVVSEAASLALLLLCYMVLLFAGVAFFSSLTWLFVGVILLVLTLWALFGLARILGTPLTVGVLATVMTAGAALYFLL